VENTDTLFQCAKCTSDEHWHVFGRVVLCCGSECPKVTDVLPKNLFSMICLDIPVHVNLSSLDYLIDAVKAVSLPAGDVFQALCVSKGCTIGSRTCNLTPFIVEDFDNYFGFVSKYPMGDESLTLLQRIELRTFLFAPLTTALSVRTFVEDGSYDFALHGLLENLMDDIEDDQLDLLLKHVRKLTIYLSDCDKDMFRGREDSVIIGLKRAFPDHLGPSNLKLVKRAVTRGCSDMVAFCLKVNIDRYEDVHRIMSKLPVAEVPPPPSPPLPPPTYTYTHPTHRARFFLEISK
jgi:hypothetical protein